MLLSKSLLAKINPNFNKTSDENIVLALNAIGIEVEKIHHSSVSSGLKLGRLIDFVKHPNSDHLNICNVVVDNKKYQIICGAKNLKLNQWVVVALDGVELKDGFKITNRNIRGIDSEGMLCSLNEILSFNNEFIGQSDKETIIQIPYDSKLNSASFFNDFAFNDTIFELTLPSNRQELNGVYFLAYELNLQFSFTTKKIDSKISQKDSLDDDFCLQIIDNPNISYNLVKFTIDINNANYWKMKMHLINSGIKITDSAQDIANFSTLICSHPTTCFNSELIQKKLKVCELENDREIINITGNKITVKKGTLVTLNENNEIVTVTGKYVNKLYSPNLENKGIYLELVNFSSDYALYQNNLNNFNDSNSIHYLKSISNSIPLIQLNFVIENLNWFMLDKPKILKLAKQLKTKKIFFNKAKLNEFLGLNLKSKDISYILSRVGIINILNHLIIPSYRQDLNNLPDISEEILKAIDINNFEAKPINFEIQNFKVQNDFERYQKIINFLVNKQFYETKTYNLTSTKKVNLFNWFNITEELNIENFASNERCVLRRNLIDQLLDVYAYNISHKKDKKNIFEIQNIQFSKNTTKNILCCLISTELFADPLIQSTVKPSIYLLVGLVNAIEEIYNLKLNKKFNLNIFNEIYNNNNLYLYDNDNIIGVAGQLDQVILSNNYGIKDPVYCLCLNLSDLENINSLKQKISTSFELNPIYKTLTFSNPSENEIKNLFAKLKTIKYITNVSLLDVFEKNNEKQYTIRLTIQPQNENLTVDIINSIFWTAIEMLRSFGLVVKEN